MYTYTFLFGIIVQLHLYLVKGQMCYLTIATNLPRKSKQKLQFLRDKKKNAKQSAIMWSNF